MGAAPHRGALSKPMTEEAVRYTSSSKFDIYIVDTTILVNIAHIKALEKINIIPGEAAAKAVKFLSLLLREGLNIPEDVEDIHIYIETLLSKEVPEVGEMLALGKSRNDAVVAAVKMKLKERLLGLAENLLATIETLLRRSIDDAATLFPVYTHLQRAAPATFGFLTHSYAVRLYKLFHSLRQLFEVVDECPLGSAAVAGTSVPIDRAYLSSLLGFHRISSNALEATSSRDFLLQTLSTLHQIAVVISDIAEELVLYSSDEFDLVVMPDEFTATSSIMPQKKNPVVAEIMRTKASELLGLYTSAAGMLTRHASGYVLDLQQTTPKMWDALDHIISSLKILREIVEKIEVNVEKANAACMPPIAAVEVANYLTLQHKISFRKAHRIAAKISELISDHKLTDDSLKQLLAENGVKVELKVADLLELMDPKKTVEGYAVYGSANPLTLSKDAEKLLTQLNDERKWLKDEEAYIENVLNELLG